MRKIIPFKKEIIFKTNLSEITSISLEHNLSKISDCEIEGDLIVSGEYKIADTSVDVEKFLYELPFSVNMDERYILDDIVIDIDDFYYEILNDKVLSINIDVSIDNLSEKEIELEPINIQKHDILEEITEENSIEDKLSEEERCIEEETIKSTIFDNMDNFSETYKSYRVYIVRDGDTLETILEKYEITKELVEEYNDLTEIKIGDKIIIPS